MAFDTLMQDAFAIVEKILELPSAKREQALADCCGANQALRQQVQAVLKAYEDPNSFLEEPVMGDFLAYLSTISQLPLDETPSSIGSYRVLDSLGQGGMGVVYKVKHSGSQKAFALKLLLNPDQDKRLLARFFTEQRVHALMKHQAMPAYHDAGMWRGKPFFLMEFVQSRGTIVNYARQQGLNLEQRMALFQQLCDGVSHAHRRMVIHRDLKPSNLLVEEQDGKAQVKILDFGIARELPGRDVLVEAKEARTMPGTIMGTWIYMAPEMLDGVRDSVSVDVFGLGALLFEMLTGEPPRDATVLGDCSWSACLDYCREPIVKSELRLRDFKAQRFEKVPRDLQRIVAKATHPDPEQRYGDVSSLQADVGAFLEGRPLRTLHTPWLVRVGKHIMRNRLATALVLLVFVGGGAAVYNEMRAQRLELQKQAVEQKLEGLSFMFGEMDAMAEAHWTQGQIGIEQSMREIAQRVQELVEKEDGAFFAPLMGRIARMLENMGFYNDAITYYEVAARGLGKGAEALEWERRSIYARSLAGQTQVALKMIQDFEQDAREAGDELQVARALRNQATMLRLLGRFDEAQSFLEAIRTTGFEYYSPYDRFRFALEEAWLAMDMHDYEDAFELFLRVWQKAPDAPLLERKVIAFAAQGVAESLMMQKKYDEALGTVDECIDLLSQSGEYVGAQLAKTKGLKASILSRLGRYEEAQVVGQEAMFMMMSLYGVDNLNTLIVSSEVGYSALVISNYFAAEKAYKIALSGMLKVGKHDDGTMIVFNNLVSSLIEQDKLIQAEVFSRQTFEVFPGLPEGASRVMEGGYVLAQILHGLIQLRLGRFQESFEVLSALRSDVIDVYGEESFELLIADIVMNVAEYKINNKKSLIEGLKGKLSQLDGENKSKYSSLVAQVLGFSI